MTPQQYDLFGEVAAAEEAAAAAADLRARDARTFLASPWTDLLGWWGHPEAIEALVDHGETKAAVNHAGWAYSIRPAGLHFERQETWGGWHHRPRHLIPWSELRAWRDAHPDVTAQIEALSAGRGHPRRLGWRWWGQPFALRGTGWHPSYYDAEQQPGYYDGDERPESAWGDRMAAWHLVIDAVSSAALRVEG